MEAIAPPQSDNSIPAIAEFVTLYDLDMKISRDEDECTEEELADLLKIFVAYWTTGPSTGQSFREWAVGRLGLTPTNPLPAYEKLYLVGNARMRECITLSMVLKKHGLYMTGDQSREVLARAFCGFKTAYEYVEREVIATQWVFDSSGFASAPLPKYISAFSMSFTHDIDSYTSTQNLMIYVLQRLLRAGFRRLGTECFQEIRVNGYGTHAWKPVIEIEEFVYKVCSKEENASMWEAATKSGNAVQDTVRYISKCYDSDFPELCPDRFLFSFRNGQYDISISRFYPLTGGGAATLASDRVAVHFFDVDFDEDALTTADWRTIETPLFDSIFTHQEYDVSTIEIVYAMLGRLMFPVNDQDDWQVVPFFKGVAGCGKSTVGQLVSYWLPPKFVSTISCNMEDKFGLAAIVDTYMCLCTEVTHNFPLNRGVWQSMVTGEAVVVARKFKNPLQGPWTVPMAMFGNELPNYEDKSGSVHRRTVVFSMRKSVDPSKADPGLLRKMQQAPAPLLVKCTRAYLELAARHGKASFWKHGVASPQLQRWHRDLLKEIDTLSAYIEEGAVVKDKYAYIPEVALIDDYRAWLDGHGIRYDKKKHWGVDHVISVFDRMGVTFSKAQKIWPLGSTTTKTGQFAFGVKLAVPEQALPADVIVESRPDPTGADEFEGDLGIDPGL